jgi:hypothetical protein
LIFEATKGGVRRNNDINAPMAFFTLALFPAQVLVLPQALRINELNSGLLK